MLLSQNSFAESRCDIMQKQIFNLFMDILKTETANIKADTAVMSGDNDALATMHQTYDQVRDLRAEKRALDRQFELECPNWTPPKK